MKIRDVYFYILGGLIVIGFFAVLVWLIIIGGYEREVGLIVGALIASFTAVVGYFFGSSKGSADKTEIMKKENR